MPLRSLRELKLFLNPSRPLLLNTIGRNSKRDLEDLPVESLSLRSAEPQRLKSESLRTELRMHSVPPELQEKKVLFQEEVLLFFTPKELLLTLKVPTLIKILVSKLSEKHAKSHAKLSAPTPVSKDPLLLTNFLKLTSLPTVSMPLKENTAT